MRKSGIYGIVVGLTVLINSCTPSQPQLLVLSHRQLSLPSASAIIFSQNRLWVFGDDAPWLSVLSTNHDVTDSIRFWPENLTRIPKEEKPDIESAYISVQNGKTVLNGLGSQSASARWRRFEFDITAHRSMGVAQLDSTIAWPGIVQRNIEGSCMIGSMLVTANRGNLSSPQNHLLIWKDSIAPLVRPLYLPPGKNFAGVSDICYVPEFDLLLFTASEEASLNAYEDGAIGESYLGWINTFSEKMNALRYEAEGWRNLSKTDPSFAGQKIEGVCVEKINGWKMTLHLVSDNDGGKSRIFKVVFQR